MQWGSKASHLCAPLVLSMRLQRVLSNHQREVVIDPVWHALCESPSQPCFQTTSTGCLHRLYSNNSIADFHAIFALMRSGCTT